MAVNETLKKETNGIKQYYKKYLTENEQDAIDLTKPFRLYTNSIRLSTLEKLNLLERETVQFYQKKLKNKEGEIQFLESQTEGY